MSSSGPQFYIDDPAFRTHYEDVNRVIGEVISSMKTPHASPIDSPLLFQEWVHSIMERNQICESAKRMIQALLFQTKPTVFHAAEAHWLQTQQGIIASMRRMTPEERLAIISVFSETELETNDTDSNYDALDLDVFVPPDKFDLYCYEVWD